MVRIELKKLGQFSTRCTGSLIATTLVLTAAHCLDHVEKEDIRLVLGSDNVRNDNEYWRQVRTIVSYDNHPNYNEKYLADIVQEFNIEENVSQLMSINTRSNLRRDTIEKSCIDHVSTNVPAKCANVSTVKDELGSSDHAAVSVLKYSRELVVKPATVRKRAYKNFNEEDFITDVRNADFSEVTGEDDIDIAAGKFGQIFVY